MSASTLVGGPVLQRLGDVTAPGLLRAVATTCCLLASADGEVDLDEIDHIAKTLRTLMPPGTAPEGIAEAVAQAARGITRRDEAAIIAAIARDLPDPDERRTALACAAGVAHANGILDFEEEIVLLNLAAAFEIPEGEARRVLDQARGAVR